jgi:hypothetical protein
MVVRHFVLPCAGIMRTSIKQISRGIRPTLIGKLP